MGKRKKKGRPSLLDLQKRSLRLQKQQELLHSHSKTPNTNPNPNPNSNPNPYLRFPHPAPPRRATRRNSDPPTDAADDDDDDEDDGDGSGGGKPRREKKLKLVLRLPHDSDPAARRIRQQVPDKTCSPAAKATDGLQGEPSDSGPTTPLPDKELLVFILDRLQKKDTYGVFSEPVDLNELPDYLDIIDHPMDFGTVRKKLSSGAYHNLEQFEKDVFLISSNAMTYNAPDTIYYRQARAIQELAKKDFENLRQESDDNEPEPKTVRRGRPPGKATTKRTPGKSADHVASDFSSDATLANARDNGHWSNLANELSRKGLISDKPGIADVFARSSYGLRSSETYCWTNEHKSERNEEHTGLAMKGVQTKYGKKPTVIDENRRNTYRQPLPSTCTHGPPILSTFDGERKQLVPVGLYMEHAYARSLARFAANLGPIGWEIAAQRIQRALPPGTKFGRGWVGESEAPQESQGPLLSSSPPHPSSQPKLLSYPATSRDDNPLDRQEPSHSNPPVEDGRSGSCYPPATAEPNRSSDAVECTESTRGLNYDERSNLLSGSGMRPKTPFHLRQSMIVQPTMNGLNAAAFGFDLSAQSGKMVRPIRPPGSFSLEASRMQGGMLDGVSRSNNSFIHQSPRSQVDVERVKTVNNPVTLSNRLSESSPDSQGPWRGLSQNPKPVSAPPDLNVSFQSPSSPASGALVDLQQPDLALQL